MGTSSVQGEILPLWNTSWESSEIKSQLFHSCICTKPNRIIGPLNGQSYLTQESSLKINIITTPWSHKYCVVLQYSFHKTSFHIRSFLRYQILHGAEQCPEKLLHHKLGGPEQREWAIFKDFVLIFPALFKEMLHMYIEPNKKSQWKITILDFWCKMVKDKKEELWIRCCTETWAMTSSNNFLIGHLRLMLFIGQWQPKTVLGVYKWAGDFMSLWWFYR